MTMQPQEKPARVLLGLHGDSTEGFLLKNQYCLECRTLMSTTVDNLCFYLHLYNQLLKAKYAFNLETLMEIEA